MPSSCGVYGTFGYIVMNYAVLRDENEDEREVIIVRLMGMDCQFIRPNLP